VGGGLSVATSHRRLDRKIRPFEKLRQGRPPGQQSVPKSAYPEIARRAKNELNSVIGQDYGVSGTTIGKIVRRAEQ
jgi:hypothetical protein